MNRAQRSAHRLAVAVVAAVLSAAFCDAYVRRARLDDALHTSSLPREGGAR